MTKRWFYVVAALVTVAVVVLYPTLSTDYSGRSQVSLILIEQKSVKNQIEVYLTSATPRQWAVPPHDGDVYRREVGSDGLVSIHVKGTDVRLLLTPKVVGSNVTWTCSSNKPRDVPPECKNPMQ